MSELHRCRVLNVEDNPGVRYARTRVLQSLGFDVTEATSGEEALALAHGNPPQLAVIDVHMPGMTGMELTQRLRAGDATSAVRILQISASSRADENLVTALSSGADAYLTEPVSNDVFGATIHALHRSYQKDAELRQALEHERSMCNEAVLQRSQWQACLASVADPLAIVDAQGKVISANDSFLLSHGISAQWDLDSFVARYESIGPDGRPLRSSDWPGTRALTGEVVRGYEIWARDRITSREWIGSFNAAPVRDSSGQVVSVLLTIRDLTSLRAGERALRESEMRSRALTHAIPNLAWTCDNDGRMVYQSAQWREYSGEVPGNSAAWTWFDFVHPEDMRVATDRWNQAVRSGQPFQADLRLRRFDGHYRWMVTRAVSHRTEGSRSLQWFGTCTDVQEFKEIEDELRASNAALQRSNDELQQFAYFASHDLQEPLRTINDFIDLLVKRYGSQLDGEPMEYLGYVRSGAERMREMITGLLEYSRAASQAWTGAPCDSSAALDWAVTNLRKQIDETGAEITCSDMPPVAADFGRLSQVMQNLISNALKYRRPGERPMVNISAVPEGDFWRFCVADNGSGVAPQYHERIFRIFKRLHGREVPGAGIGLALCRRIVERQGGRIWVESRMDGGSQFYFTLPRVERVAATA